MTEHQWEWVLSVTRNFTRKLPLFTVHRQATIHSAAWVGSGTAVEVQDLRGRDVRHVVSESGWLCVAHIARLSIPRREVARAKSFSTKQEAEEWLGWIQEQLKAMED